MPRSIGWRIIPAMIEEVESETERWLSLSLAYVIIIIHADAHPRFWPTTWLRLEKQVSEAGAFWESPRRSLVNLVNRAVLEHCFVQCGLD